MRCFIVFFYLADGMSGSLGYITSDGSYVNKKGVVKKIEEEGIVDPQISNVIELSPRDYRDFFE